MNYANVGDGWSFRTNPKLRITRQQIRCQPLPAQSALDAIRQRVARPAPASHNRITEKGRREKLELATAAALFSKDISFEEITRIMDMTSKAVQKILSRE
ncbi:hypothetical protein [Achromobacter ruhlandii]|uniref:hypothetical protein n=1 Tax=Achromobacter ruhlandii TaxID=72557 RepID=UPI001EED03E6|nr:hypothetical protein [Achromobacter ruhlandii]MCZ8398158.1 hypothetical protein [Achromobacter ruhlandii]